MKHRVMLDYSLGEGWLAPWIEGLRKGFAVGSTCASCDTVQFPPLRFCPGCGERSSGWHTLKGGATILFRTTGADGDFALARFDGAERAAVVRTENLPQGSARGVLLPAPEGPPLLGLQGEGGS